LKYSYIKRGPHAPTKLPTHCATPFMIFNVTYIFAKGLNYMLRGLKLSRALIANMIPFVNISNFFKCKKKYTL
jgi:hypothetical protein